jgi:arylsulfatase A-like enzyme
LAPWSRSGQSASPSFWALPAFFALLAIPLRRGALKTRALDQILRVSRVPENGTIGRILQENGYRTSWFGKNHNTPAFQTSQAGPFNQWPTGMGFDYFYGFNAGDVSQWEPMLTRNTTPITVTIKLDFEEPRAGRH